jgi:hypothetical protein
MAFHTARYDVYAVLGDPDAQRLWNWTIWQRFASAIDPLIKAARGKPAIRSTQFLPNQIDDVKFGRLGWNEADHQKWTHGSPKTKKSSKSWDFRDVEIWAPAWNACEREDLAPDVFLSVANESDGSDDETLLFNPVVVLAVVSELAQQKPAEVRAAVSALQKLTSAKLVGYKQRPWGKSTSSYGYSDSIQELSQLGLFKAGPRHKSKVGFHLFAGKWQPVGPGRTKP